MPAARAECIDNRRLDVEDGTNIILRRACEDCKQTWFEISNL